MSDDAHGTTSWDAMASPDPAHNRAMLAEVAALLNRLYAVHGQPGPLDESCHWDCDLHIETDDGVTLTWHWATQQVQWAWPDGQIPHARLHLNLSLTGDTAFTHTLEQESTAA